MMVRDQILEEKIIVIVRRTYGQNLLELSHALYDGGIRFMEVTFDQSDPECITKTGQAISMLVNEYGSAMHFGAGTVLSTDQVNAAKLAGGEFIISPNFDPAVVRRTLELKMTSIPGAMTPSEIIAAHNAGADLVKLFPAGRLGVGYVKDILAPISHVKLIATAGITEENFADYLNVGMAGAGISGRLTDKHLIAEENWNELTARAMRFVHIAQEASTVG